MNRLTGAVLACILVFVLLIRVGPVRAHEVRHTVEMEQAVVVHLIEEDNAPFADEHVEIFGPGDTDPFLVERTDADGRIAFFPDRDGEWRLRAFSEDGHGVDFTIDTREIEGAVHIQPADVATDRRAYTVLGIGIILALFGVAALMHRRVSP